MHLIRDLNDDLWEHPFDDEFDLFILAVRDLLAPILEDVQRFGLKAYHLRKHRHRVDRFYREQITGRASTEEIGNLFSPSLKMITFRGTTMLQKERFVT